MKVSPLNDSLISHAPLLWQGFGWQGPAGNRRRKWQNIEECVWCNNTYSNRLHLIPFPITMHKSIHSRPSLGTLGMRFWQHDNHDFTLYTTITAPKLVVLKNPGMNKLPFFPLNTIYYICKQHIEYLEHLVNLYVKIILVLLHTSWGMSEISRGQLTQERRFGRKQ